jgi:hypothetical protein
MFNTHMKFGSNVPDGVEAKAYDTGENLSLIRKN